MKLNTSEYIILGFVSKNPLSGYDIKQLMLKLGDYKWTISNAQIYPILKSLKNKKLVAICGNSNADGRQKKVYRITAAGDAELVNWLTTDTPVSPYREEMLLKLSLANRISKAQSREMLQTYLKKITEKLESYKIVKEHIQTKFADRPEQFYLNIVHNHVVMVCEAKLAWAKQTLKML